MLVQCSCVENSGQYSYFLSAINHYHMVTVVKNSSQYSCILTKTLCSQSYKAVSSFCM
jgi:hypothetical protein